MQVIVHGGAGALDTKRHARCIAGCEAAARAAWALLEQGVSALDAAEAAVVALEDDPAFNAGTGAVLRVDGYPALDAMLMDGTTLAAGGVAVVRRLANPVRAARAVLAAGRYVLLAGEDAEAFAADAGLVRCDPESLVVDRERHALRDSNGTVGCAVRDAHGRLAAATSTGGRTGARVGRIGDSPLPGAGTYADGFAAVSATGPGEVIMRVVLAHATARDIAGGAAPATACRRALERLLRLTGARAGLIAADSRGRLGCHCSDRHMPAARIDRDGLHSTV